MYDKPQLGLAQIRVAMNAMLDEANKDPGHPVAISVSDEQGNLLAYFSMDNTRPSAQRMARKKSYTAAFGGVDTLAYAERLKGQGRSVAELGDPNLAAVQGGVVVVRPSDGAVLGGIGVSGRSAQDDENLARIGLKAWVCRPYLGLGYPLGQMQANGRVPTRKVLLGRGPTIDHQLAAGDE